MQQKRPLKYLGYAVVFEEVPDEISLAFNISGCEHKCEGCHSKYLWVYEGEYLKEDLLNIVSKYDGLISCVCFLGGDQNLDELFELCKIVKELRLKTCIYSGEDSYLPFTKLIDDNLIDYLKIGKYDSQKGALNTVGTNQIMYKVVDEKLVDITYMFQKKRDEKYDN